ncbi:carotenoid oxygenase family protein [Vitiosangium sp. GDMCC 1.1324]|uniref:carotenoid oxygenase family protein n=1 Tax=Vitiosangium sp. (strain GDMCC 1.1324) TaxID=2138576 RepID=UPI000D368A70|nr:carotenoid oxygenase family protein [Vitiosangium sp. GDMCC 1.1324]PTL85400.1 carotenoid oxygenase [Vitiosangium sp. GDMCC 1.1324]
MTSTMAAKRPGAPEQPGWRGVFRDFTQDHGFQPLRVEGRLPEDLRGTLLRVGPVAFGVGAQRYGHWFDGDGGLLAVRFEGSGAQGAARLINTPTIQAERNAGKLIYSNYGTSVPLWRKLMMRGKKKNSANTSVMAWNGRLFALFEATQPTELSPEDLRVLGETDLDVIVSNFSAHPHRVPARKATYNFGMQYGRETLLELYELPDGGAARHLGQVPLPRPTMIHDFIATERHLIFFVTPLRLNVFRMLLKLGTYSENLEWRPELGTEVLVIPIDDLANPVRIETEPLYTWHFANAYEREDGSLVVDYVRQPDFSSTHTWLGELTHGVPSADAQGRLHRATVDLKARTFRTEERSALSCEFPRVAPRDQTREYRYLYVGVHSKAAALRGPFDAVAKVDMTTGREELFGPYGEQYPAEPVFVPRAGATQEDDGYVLTQVYDVPSGLTHVAVLDARNPGADPLARAWFEHSFPITFHGGFMPAK